MDGQSLMVSQYGEHCPHRCDTYNTYHCALPLHICSVACNECTSFPTPCRRLERDFVKEIFVNVTYM